MISSSQFPSEISSILAMGAVRSGIVNTATYPLDVIKTIQQASSVPARSTEIASRLFRSEGMQGLYRGFAPALIKGLVKQTIWWPVIAYVPPRLQDAGISGVKQHVITGVSVATLDACLNTPLEKWRVLNSLGKQTLVSSSSMMTHGWHGFLPYWRRQGVTWSLFLLGQHHFSKPYKNKDARKPLSLSHILTVAFKLSAIASLVIMPLDTLNTVKQSQVPGEVKKQTLRGVQLYRGLPMCFLALMIQNTATVFLMDRVQKIS